MVFPLPSGAITHWVTNESYKCVLFASKDGGQISAARRTDTSAIRGSYRSGLLICQQKEGRRKIRKVMIFVSSGIIYIRTFSPYSVRWMLLCAHWSSTCLCCSLQQHRLWICKMYIMLLMFQASVCTFRAFTCLHLCSSLPVLCPAFPLIKYLRLASWSKHFISYILYQILTPVVLHWSELWP